MQGTGNRLRGQFIVRRIPVLCLRGPPFSP